MGLVAYLLPLPTTGGDPFFIAVAQVMGFGNLAWAFGWLLHVINRDGDRDNLRVRRDERQVADTSAGEQAPGRGDGGRGRLGCPVRPALALPVACSRFRQSVSDGLVINVLFGLILVVVFAFGQAFGLTESQITEYRCETCGASFETLREVEAHRSQEHRVLQPPIGA